MSHSFSLSFRLGERAGDGIRDVVWLIAKHIHLHDKRAGVSISWVMPPFRTIWLLSVPAPVLKATV